MVFIQVHHSADQKRNIIFLCQIQYISKCVYFQFIRIIIIASVDSVIKRQKIFFFLKYQSEKTIFILSVGCRIFLIIIKFLC